MSNQLASALYYAYPVSLCLTLLTSYLFLYRQQSKIQNELPFRKRKFRLVFWLQACLLLVLCASIVVGVFSYRQAIAHHSDLESSQAELASLIAITVYFGSGLLPDPDGPFTPKLPHFHAWLVAGAFETVILGVSQALAMNASLIAVVDGVLGALRLLLLLSIVVVFAKQEYWDVWRRPFGTDIEREALLQNGNSHSKHEMSSASQQGGASVGGWLDYFHGFKRLFPYIWPSDSTKQQLVIFGCFVLLILQRIVNLLVPQQFGMLVESLGVGTIPYKQIALYCLYRGLQGQQGIIGSLRAILWIPISQSLYRRLTTATYSHVLLLSLDFHLSKRIGEVISALEKGGALNTFLDGFAFQLFPMVFDLAIAAIWLFVKFDAFYSIIVVTVMWNYIFVTIYMAKYRGKARREMATRQRNMEAAKTDAILAYETVHYNNAFSLEISKFEWLARVFQRAEFSVLFSLNGLNAIQNGIFMLGVVIVCGLSAYQISMGEYKVSDFVTLITYFAQLHAPLAFFGSFYNQVQNNLVDAERMLELFNTKPDVEDAPEAQPISTIDGRIIVSNLIFAYNNGRRALDDISFIVEPGTSTAIVGESGSGKSTILKLLYRFYNAQSGHISIDGHDVLNITIESLRQHIGVVPQDTLLFNDSIKYNLLYARPDASEEEMVAACQAASIHEKILGFLEGYGTVVGERGLKLSGGEKQRVAIARAVLKNPTIMLLDEATSSLDTHTEKLIQGALEQVTKGRTTITIAHRLSTITHADQILVMNRGKIVERGVHAELLAMGGRYASMWEKQTEIEKQKDI